MLFTQSYAAEVKIDFNAMDHPTSSSESQDGDINETWTYSQDGVTISVSPKDEGVTNPNRFWGTNKGPQLRCYSGTITISATEAMTKMEFAVNSSKFALTPSVGTLDGYTWTGSATEVVFTVNGNTQLNGITVTIGGGGETPPDPETVDIAGFKAIEVGTEATLRLQNAQVLFATTTDIFVRDNSGAIDFYRTDLGYTQNQLLTGTITGMLNVFRGLPELTKGDNFQSNITATNGTAATPVEITIDKADSKYECDLILIKNLTLRQEDGNWYGDANGQSIQVYDKFKLNYTPEAGKTYDITGILIPYNDIFEIAPIVDFTNGETPPPPPVGDKKLFKKATTVESGKQYLIAANTEGNAYAVAKPVGTNYGYLKVDMVEATNDVITQDNLENAITITAATGGYTLLQSDGRYLYQTGNFNSFNVDAAPTEGEIWDIMGSDGIFVIKNVSVNKYVQYSTKYSSYGSYPDEQGILPSLFVLDESNGIDVINATTTRAQRYTLSGQRVDTTYRGIVIENGRKFIVK